MISAIITTLNDSAELAKTVQSIRATSQGVEIVIVDDASYMPVQCAEAKVVHNPIRIGVGPSRHIGVLNATQPFILLLDSHMRFESGWLEKMLPRLQSNPQTIYCTTCLSLRHETMSMAQAISEYCGATLNVYGPDRNDPGRKQVFEAVWNTSKPANDAEICCVMGANYFMACDWFLKISPLRHLRQWGQDETMLSVKSWLAGGDCRFVSDVRIGHRFSDAKQKSFILQSGYPTANRTFAIRTLCPPKLADKLIELLEKVEPSKEIQDANLILRNDQHTIRVEQDRNRSLFTRDFYWLAQKFGLALPPH